MLPLLASALAMLAAHADDIAYPDTEPARHAREYFPAYNADEAAMRAYFAAHVGPEDLKARSIDARVGIWREIQSNQGRLTPVRVAESGDSFITMLVKNGEGLMLTIRFNCRADAPHTLVGLMIAPADEDPGGAAHEAEKPREVEGPPAGPPPSDATIVRDLRTRLDSLARAGEFSGAALLDKGGKTLFAKAYGMESRRQKRPNQLDTRFNLGSLNKIFTTVAIQQLDQARKLQLDDTIDRYLVDYPSEAAEKITIRMLLEHRAGVPDVLENEALWKNPESVRSAGQWYDLIRERPLEFEPGTKQRYSNGGYAILGMIVERVSGEDYYEYVRQHIYQPAGMTRTDSYTIEERRGDFATGYSRHPESPPNRDRDTGPWYEAPQTLGRGSAAGGGYSTVGEMVRFAQALRQHKLLDAAHTERMISADTRLGIAGGSPGCNALFELEGPYTLVILANVDPPAAEGFAKTTGRLIRSAAGFGGGPQEIIRAGARAH
jgi:CubicO group peptidase (beta-lactamase class C family)